jgi:RND family efflux transporter MFP subunit
VLIVLLLLTGSLWIMAHLNQNMGLMDRAMQMHRDRGDGSRVVTTTGLVRRTATEPVFAGVTGEIKEIRCNANMRVKAGALCAKIDPDPYQVALDRRKADLASAEARLAKDKAAVLSAKAAFEGKGALFNSRSISKRAFDKARESLEAAQREYDRNEAHAADLKLAVQSAETNFRLTDIVAPIDGTVITRNVNLGEKVALNSKTPLFVIATDGGLVEIGAAIIGEDSKALKLGGKVSVTINGLPDHTLPGVVTQIRRAAETEVPGDSADVLINVTDPDHLLEPGMAATISIVTE